MSYRTEFPDFDTTIPAIAGMQDESWHNDTCPKLVGRGFVLFCDYANHALREYTDSALFILCRDDEEMVELLKTDDLTAVVAMIEAR